MPYLFLSPSTQEFNEYVTGTGSEEYWMNRIADAMMPYLRSSGITTTRNDPSGTATTSIRQSNLGNYDFHLALHSNASGPGSEGQNQGSIAFYYPTSTDGLRMAEIIADNLKQIYPQPDLVRAEPIATLGELRRTRAPSVLVEIAFHDNVADAQWIENNVATIARNLVLSVTEYFGLPLVDPIEDYTATVQRGPLPLRNAPATGAPVLLEIPAGASVTVTGLYEGWAVVDYQGTLGYVESAGLA